MTRGGIKSLSQLALLAAICISVILSLSGCDGDNPVNDNGNAPPEELTLAIFGGIWEGDFSVSSSQQGLHAYAEISQRSESGRRFVLIMLANIPQSQGWMFTGTCPANGASVFCTFTDDTELVFGGFFPSGVTETSDGALRYTASAPTDALLTPDGVTRDGRSKIRYIYQAGLEKGRSATVEIEAYSTSGQHITGMLRGTLISIQSTALETESCGPLCLRVKSLQTAPRPGAVR